MTNYFLTVLFLILYNTLIAQPKSFSFDSLDKEFRYKVVGKTLQDRGENLFVKDLEALLATSQVFKKYKDRDGFSSVFINIDYKNNRPYIAKLDFSTLGIFSIDYKNEMTKLINKLLIHFKPAQYKGKPLLMKYHFAFDVAKGDKFNIKKLRFYRSRPDYYVNANCFEIYREKNGNALFLSTEIIPEYKGGNEILISHLNKLFNSTRLISIGKVDSLDVEFVITQEGHFSLDGKYTVKSKIESILIEKLKLLSCNWSPGLMSGRPVFVKNKYRFYYTNSKNNTGKVFLKIHNLKKI